VLPPTPPLQSSTSLWKREVAVFLASENFSLCSIFQRS
jgi:hypothetical protein